MIAFLLWCFLFIVCWPIALLALVLYPLVWLLLLPFRLVGIAVHGALALVWAVVMLPATAVPPPTEISNVLVPAAYAAPAPLNVVLSKLVAVAPLWKEPEPSRLALSPTTDTLKASP